MATATSNKDKIDRIRGITLSFVNDIKETPQLIFSRIE
ncbi:LSU ribosomal protein L5p (L11e) [Crocosphaera watsonii WH 0402]|uniref:LSU ribosomal protein L5p (L11e) n=2 Tax=Crocosphaera watsonii TaxID=263511 RepID=T2JXS4_CROWT|nr:LSU ribosomal protein L5p (L11e) [Crocosphaera watsonii WH 0401]CCQ69447.1 LSU ribosomal protein L5p (L11e) [Crocosphaera watsonii WH 0402]